MTKYSFQVKILAHICLAIVCSYCLLTVEGRRPTCPQSTHFTIFYPRNQEGKETCRICPICPPAHGLPIQCGNRVANGTSTDCKPCPNGTYSKNNDSSECKACDKCEGRYVQQPCSSRENGKCGKCLPGYYLDPYVDDCKECFFCCDDVPEGDHLKECKDLGMPWNMQCEATVANKKCKLKAILLNRTTARPITTVSSLSKRTGAIGSAGTAKTPSGITANNSTTNNASKLHPVPINETEIINESKDEDYGSSGGEWYKTKGFVAAVVGILPIIIIIAVTSYFAVKKLRQSGHGNQVYNSVEQDGRHGEAIELQNLGNNVPPHQNNVNGTTTPLLENQSTESSYYTAASSLVNGSTPPLSENQSTESSVTSSTELLHANKEETTGRDNLNIDYLRIPEERVVSDMEWLRDHSGSLMLFQVQNELDAIDTIQNKTWRSVGRALGVTTQKLNLIETCYKAGKSPTEELVEHLKTRGNAEPKMRKFVVALIACKKIDVARVICNWPWEINQGNDSN